MHARPVQPSMFPVMKECHLQSQGYPMPPAFTQKSRMGSPTVVCNGASLWLQILSLSCLLSLPRPWAWASDPLHSSEQSALPCGSESWLSHGHGQVG